MWSARSLPVRPDHRILAGGAADVLRQSDHVIGVGPRTRSGHRQKPESPRITIWTLGHFCRTDGILWPSASFNNPQGVALDPIAASCGSPIRQTTTIRRAIGLTHHHRQHRIRSELIVVVQIFIAQTQSVHQPVVAESGNDRPGQKGTSGFSDGEGTSALFRQPDGHCGRSAAAPTDPRLRTARPGIGGGPPLSNSHES